MCDGEAPLAHELVLERVQALEVVLEYEWELVWAHANVLAPPGRTPWLVTGERKYMDRNAANHHRRTRCHAPVARTGRTQSDHARGARRV